MKVSKMYITQLVLVMAACMGFAGPLFAQATTTEQLKRTYAVLSLIGDKLDIVSQVLRTGTNLDSNQHNEVPVGSPVFDNAALLSAQEAVAKRQPDAKVLLLRSNDTELFDMQARWLNANSDNSQLLKKVLDIAKGGQASHIILVAKHSAEADLRSAHDHHGQGRLKGLGFYMDRTTAMSRADTGEGAKGFLGPYCHIKVLLLDAQSGEILRTQSTAKGYVIATTQGENATHPWDALTAKQKMTAIQEMVESETERLVTKILSQ